MPQVRPGFDPRTGKALPPQQPDRLPGVDYAQQVQAQAVQQNQEALRQQQLRQQQLSQVQSQIVAQPPVPSPVSQRQNVAPVEPPQPPSALLQQANPRAPLQMPRPTAVPPRQLTIGEQVGDLRQDQNALEKALGVNQGGNLFLPGKKTKLTGALEGGIMGLGMTPGSQTTGEGISNVARTIMGLPAAKRAMQRSRTEEALAELAPAAKMRQQMETAKSAQRKAEADLQKIQSETQRNKAQVLKDNQQAAKYAAEAGLIEAGKFEFVRDGGRNFVTNDKGQVLIYNPTTQETKAIKDPFLTSSPADELLGYTGEKIAIKAKLDAFLEKNKQYTSKDPKRPYSKIPKEHIDTLVTEARRTPAAEGTLLSLPLRKEALELSRRRLTASSAAGRRRASQEQLRFLRDNLKEEVRNIFGGGPIQELVNQEGFMKALRQVHTQFYEGESFEEVLRMAYDFDVAEAAADAPTAAPSSTTQRTPAMLQEMLETVFADANPEGFFNDAKAAGVPGFTGTFDEFLDAFKDVNTQAPGN